jgi:hypothetical protein
MPLAHMDRTAAAYLEAIDRVQHRAARLTAMV